MAAPRTPLPQKRRHGPRSPCGGEACFSAASCPMFSRQRGDPAMSCNLLSPTLQSASPRVQRGNLAEKQSFWQRCSLGERGSLWERVIVGQRGTLCDRGSPRKDDSTQSSGAASLPCGSNLRLGEIVRTSQDKAQGRGESPPLPLQDQKGAERVQGWGQSPTPSGETSDSEPESLEQEIKDMLRFSHLLDEVTCRILDSDSLQAFSATMPRVRPNEPVWSAPDWARSLPCCVVLDASEALRRIPGVSGEAYLETNIDSTRKEEEPVTSGVWRETLPEREGRCTDALPEFVPRIPESGQGPSPLFSFSQSWPKSPHRSTSLPWDISTVSAKLHTSGVPSI
ncbi:hypothetical protein AAFF_G00203370 [Aldrovandia affinis]|uniref:Uncharacterized protein n=1 Tax=Aldrovandia affinis TaxID=143900 RepID=A0AAD7SX67_9TELE|nr:hypothetical protein AAFF_G00203370 [Aldrovandia affinis]